MNVLFEYKVWLRGAPMPPPTKENCEKCCFDRNLCNALTTHACAYGAWGYFVLDRLTCKTPGEALIC